MKTLCKNLSLKYYFIILLILFPLSTLLAQNNKGMSGVEIVKTTTQEVLDINTTTETVDALKYTVTYYDGFEEKMGEKNFKWQSGNIIKSIQPGKTTKDYHANWIKGANKIKVVITRVHFADNKDN
jgi:hypothetical protein